MNLKSPAVMSGATQEIYVHLEDVDTHHKIAQAAGTKIIMELEDTEYGSCEYIAHDIEGHLWSFSTCAPAVKG